ncbi:MAG: hypothetical protein KAJ09_06965 [Deltaproteobacteria bacterium]|nr:hypothetical protein [Deltaproteobacteria bacterium]
MADNIPKEINGWVAHPEVRRYGRKTLFKYIDGGAELYLAYRFRKVYVHTYTRAGEPDIIMDIYDMSTPEDAFGVFTAEREGDDIGIGMEAEYEAGLLRFCKGQFFVSIMTYEETRESGKTVLSLARAVADAIQSIGGKPQLLSFLPEKGLIERSIRYFHDHNILNLNYYIADENILHLDSHTEAVLARYSGKEGKPYLLLVKYPSTHHAKRAFGSFLNAYMPDAGESKIVRTENGTWTAADVYSTFVAVVLDVPSEGWARSLLEAQRAKLRVRR